MLAFIANTIRYFILELVQEPYEVKVSSTVLKKRYLQREVSTLTRLKYTDKNIEIRVMIFTTLISIQV